MIKELRKMQSDIADLESAVANYCNKAEVDKEGKDKGKTVEKAKLNPKMGTLPLMMHPQVYSSKETAKAASEDVGLAVILGKLNDLI